MSATDNRSDTDSAKGRDQRAARRRLQQSDNEHYSTMNSFELETSSSPNSPSFYSRHFTYGDEEPLIDDAGDGSSSPSHNRRGLRQDLNSILLLLFLYLLQGIPIGISSSIPLILQNRHVTYHQQALFSFAIWPFSLKLLWAPLVDSVFSSRIGRRKSWLVPTQYLIGIFMYFFSNHVETILGDDADHKSPNMYALTALFFALNFLAATQDIAVDGWALTMLSKHNVGYASTCNAVGQTAGFFAGNAIFLSLESPEFCNAYLRSEPLPYGIVTLADFVWFWSIVFIVTTTLVLVLKHEVDHRAVEGDAGDIEDLDIVSAYKLLWKIIRLKPVVITCCLMLTAKIAFAAGDGITGLKLIEMGVPKDKLALIAIPLVPLQIVLPWILGRYTAGPRPMNVFQRAYPFKIISCVLFAVVVYYTPSWQLPDKSFPVSFYLLIIATYCFHSIASYSLYVAVMAFYAQVSDPTVGGTYMTLLNTITNLGGNWPVTLALSLIDDLTWKECQFGDVVNSNSTQYAGTDCSSDDLQTTCTQVGGSCITSTDGYYTLIGICLVFGLIWWQYTKRTIYNLQSQDKDSWACFTRIASRKSISKM